MNEATLRAWVRGELAADERREVTRWLVRCTDPRLGPLLVGLAEEARLERRTAWDDVRDAFFALLDAGRAALAGPDLAAAVTAEVSADPSPPALLAADGDAAQIHAPPGAAVYARWPDGRVERAGDRIEAPEHDLLVFAMPTELVRAADPASALAQALASGDPRVQAARWVAPEG